MSEPQPSAAAPRRLATPIILALIAATHLLYPVIVDLRDLPSLAPALVMSLALGGAYAYASWRDKVVGAYKLAVSLIVAEDLGVLAAGLALGYPWGDHLRPATPVLLALQLALAFSEIVARQEARRPIVAATRLGWFVIAYALAFAGYTLLKPGGVWAL